MSLELVSETLSEDSETDREDQLLKDEWAKPPRSWANIARMCNDKDYKQVKNRARMLAEKHGWPAAISPKKPETKGTKQRKQTQQPRATKSDALIDKLTDTLGTGHFSPQIQ